MALLAERKINRLFVEAGAKLAESFIAGELIDRLHIVDSSQKTWVSRFWLVCAARTANAMVSELTMRMAVLAVPHQTLR